MVFTAFDPVAGRGAKLTSMDIDPKADYRWDLSPDSRCIAAVKMTGTYAGDEMQATEGPIHILSLDRQPSFELVAKGRKNKWQSLDWAADGNGLYVSADVVDMEAGDSIVAALAYQSTFKLGARIALCQKRRSIGGAEAPEDFRPV